MQVAKSSVLGDRAVYKSMYRWILLTMLALGFTMFCICLLGGNWENIAADPLSFLADILVRSLAGPIIVIPYVLNYYRGKMHRKTYIQECDSEAWGIATIPAAIITLFTMLFSVLAYADDHTNALLVGSMISGAVVGIAYAIARSFAILVSAQAVCCSLIIFIGSFAGFKVCAYLLAVSLSCYAMIWLLILIIDALVNPGKINKRAKMVFRKLGDWLHPEPQSKA